MTGIVHFGCGGGGAEQDSPLEQMKTFRRALNDAYANPPFPKAGSGTGIIEQQRRWNPYSFETGTCAAIQGDNFAVIGSNSRMLNQIGFGVLTRELDNTLHLNDKVVLALSGFRGDIIHLERILNLRFHKFKFDYDEEMPVEMCSQMLQLTHYSRRFFPIITGTILAGIDGKGCGAVYRFGPVGSMERLPYAASGDASATIDSFFDAQVAELGLQGEGAQKSDLTLDKAKSLMKDAFRMAAERNSNTGDSVHLLVCQAGKPVVRELVPLRED